MVKLASLACSRSVAFVKALRGSYNHESTRQARIYYCVLSFCVAHLLSLTDELPWAEILIAEQGLEPRPLSSQSKRTKTQS